MGSGEENEAIPETPENQTAEGLARLTRIDRAAEDAALGAVPGEAREVEVGGDDGALHEVVVDAGNGKVLGREVEENEGF